MGAGLYDCVLALITDIFSEVLFINEKFIQERN